jgi:hypothetical protein
LICLLRELELVLDVIDMVGFLGFEKIMGIVLKHKTDLAVQKLSKPKNTNAYCP